MGYKERRSDNYLTHAKRQPGGRLLPQIDNVTLKQRTVDFNESMKAQRNKLNPKSENLSDMVSGIVGSLEKKFDNIKDKMRSTSGVGTEWKEISLTNTISEIPRIPIAGTETGGFNGYASKIYADLDDPGFDPSQTLPANLMKDGKWKGSVEIRAALREVNNAVLAICCHHRNRGLQYSSTLLLIKSIIIYFVGKSSA